VSEVEDKLFEKRIEAMNNIANGNLSSNIKGKSNNHLQGAVIGGILGLVTAIALRTKPIYGIAIGGVLGRLVVKKIK
tara:strand:+ start:258 stop:488 length:231 start_codon:yes stop_codon:yes gene_type:complete